MSTTHYTINGTTLTFARDTGALTALSNPACGRLVRGGRGLIDVAWPVKLRYEILRADPCGKHKPCPPEIEGDERGVTLTWQALPMNTVMPQLPELEGGVWAQVRITPWEDGKSLCLSCRVENRSQTPVRQVLFPDLSGLLPVAGTDGTRFTGLKGYALPFRELRDEGDMKDQFYASKPSLCGKFYPAGGYFGESMRVGRWYDFGGLSGGFSLYCRHWGYGPDDANDMGRQDVAWVKLNNLENTLRIANVHYMTLQQGQVYESPCYILTPHAGGWAQGVGPYKQWVDQNKHRVVPPPKRITEALGFRTIWATEQYPDDPDAAIWPYESYPLVAQDMLEHGLNILNVWGMCSWILPMGEQSFFQNQGGFAKLKEVAAQLRSMGVRLSPLISVLSLWEEMRQRYGYEKNDGSSLGWSENLKGVPNFTTPYMERYCCAFLHNQDNPLWIQDVKDAFRFLRDQLGVPDICWDQYVLDKRVLYDIIDEYRRETQAIDPDADFSGESTFFFEADIDQLDYTWVWIYRNGDMRQDTAPYSYVVETTRPQMNVDSNPIYAKYCFMDNVMMNVYPSKPDNINGSAFIREVPALSQALKQCAALRKAYLPYFTQGKILGDCVLSQDCPGARVTGYVRGDKSVLFAVLRQTEAQVHFDLSPFLCAGEYDVDIRDADDKTIALCRTEDKGCLTLSGEIGDLFVLEFTPRQ
ncbi:MAG TPA: hypothetical protein IAA58_12425 [Candidatus Gallacutalibacter stercoravium]|nr:hypothetical protein [Candidatus Gallacutalibacter stercoravium]